MPCDRCNAITATNNRCKLRTCVRFPYCWIHLRSIDGLMVRASTIPGAGLGLFANRRFQRNHRITKYSSHEISRTANQDSDYVLKISANQFMDSESLRNYPGRFINSNANTGRPANARFAQGYQIHRDNRYNLRWISVYAIRRIEKGDEILIDYGDEYNI